MARQTPFFRSLSEPNLVFGVDRTAFVLLLMSCIALLMVLRSVWVVVAHIGLYVILRFIFRSDPLFMRIYAAYSKEGDSYEPFVRARQALSGRKPGRGKGLLC